MVSSLQLMSTQPFYQLEQMYRYSDGTIIQTWQYKIQFENIHRLWTHALTCALKRGGGGNYILFSIVYTCTWGVGVQSILSFFFFSIVWHAITQRRKPAIRGVASQQLWTFKRMDISNRCFGNHVPNNQCWNCIFSIILQQAGPTRRYELTLFIWS